jgi:hypothetical protein
MSEPASESMSQRLREVSQRLREVSQRLRDAFDLSGPAERCEGER